MSANDTISSAGQGHDRSAPEQQHDQPALDYSREQHHYDQTTVLPSKQDDLMFNAKGTDAYAGGDATASPDYKVRPMSSSNDEESGGVGEIRNGNEKAGWRAWTFKRVYAKYKILFHLAIWAVWTA